MNANEQIGSLLAIIGVLLLIISPIPGYITNGGVGVVAGITFAIPVIVAGFASFSGSLLGPLFAGIIVWLIETAIMFFCVNGAFMKAVILCQRRGWSYCFSMNILPWLIGAFFVSLIVTVICSCLQKRYG